MSHNEVRNNGIINLGKTLQTNTMLQILDISYNKISDDGVTAFSDYLKKSKLRELRISWNYYIYLVLDFMIQSCTMSKMNLGNTGTILISALLSGNSYTYKLDISHSNISDDEAIAISECLKHNNTLQELNVSYNEVSNNGFTYIGKALLINTTLQILNISHNKISDDGAVAIGECLTKSNTLQSSAYSTTTEEISKIAEAIVVNTGLHTLDLSSQHVNDPVHFIMTLLTAITAL